MSPPGPEARVRTASRDSARPTAQPAYPTPAALPAALAPAGDLARDCRGLANCTDVPTSVLPAGHNMKVIQRNYLRPGGTRGADPEQLLNPWSIVLDGTKRP